MGLDAGIEPRGIHDGIVRNACQRRGIHMVFQMAVLLRKIFLASLQLLAGAVLPVGKGLLGGVIDQLGGKRSLRLLGLLEESGPLQQCVQQGTFAGAEMPHHKQLDFKMISQLFGQLKCVLKIPVRIMCLQLLAHRKCMVKLFTIYHCFSPSSWILSLLNGPASGMALPKFAKIRRDL